MFYPGAEANSGPIQATKMDLFAIIVNEFKLTLLAFPTEDVWRGVEYTSPVQM